MQPAEPPLEEPPLEEPGDSEEPSMERSSEQTLDLQSEPTVTFLFTLLNTPEPKDGESDTETLEQQFLSQEDWGPRRTSEEIQNLQKECQRLQEALKDNKRDNLALEEKLESLATSLYENLEKTLLTPKNYRVTQKTAEVSQEEAGVTQEEAEDTQEKAEDTQEKAEDTQEKAEDTQEKAEDTQEKGGKQKDGGNSPGPGGAFRSGLRLLQEFASQSLSSLGSQPH
ncbi:aspartic and glutamic acid-rich protein-like [Cricetulus griseus]|uniref:aspartic and glutamic acid-rich protein-like n=1 Tax=Cricetulus griseus TaxID=10029 RepID=UPI0015C3FAE7|nr:aspartic and glutamic acid-rich protein-like [Cricetulus griseus]